MTNTEVKKSNNKQGEAVIQKGRLIELDGEKVYLLHPNHCDKYPSCFECKNLNGVCNWR